MIGGRRLVSGLSDCRSGQSSFVLTVTVAAARATNMTSASASTARASHRCGVRVMATPE